MNLIRTRSLQSNALLALACLALSSCGGGSSNSPGESANTYVFVSPYEVSVAPGQAIQMQVDIANLPTGQNASGYAISLSEEATRISITSTECESGAGTSSCRLWTIRPEADAAPGTYSFEVRASGIVYGLPGAATIRVLALEDIFATRAVIAASLDHVVTADGRLWGRGLNNDGATGVGFKSVGFDVDDSFLLPDVIENFVRVGTDTDWSAVASDGGSVIALKANGTVWGWGENLRIDLSDAFYRFGFSSEFIGKIETSIQLRPRQIAGLPPIKAISANNGRFLALAVDGTVYGFGGNSRASADDIVRQAPGGFTSRRTDEPQAVPVSVDGTPLRNIVAISGAVQNSGRGWAVALDADGKVWQMGRRGSNFVAAGPAGDAVATAAMPKLVAIESTVVAVVAGDAFSVAATNAGEVWSWTEGALTPIQVQGLSDIVALDSNGEDVSALDTQGRVWIISDFGRGVPRQIMGIPPMSRLGNRAPKWALSADCAAGRGRLWNMKYLPTNAKTSGRMVGLFAQQGLDSCGASGSVQLTLGKVGKGAVSTDPAGYDPDDLIGVCNVDCAGPIVLTVRRRNALPVHATPAPGWWFEGFNAECADGNPLLDIDTTCIARFRPSEKVGRLTVSISGGGRVTSLPAGIDCGTNCSELYSLGTEIRLTAVPDPGFAFVSWTGPSNTNQRDCSDGTVSMNVIGQEVVVNGNPEMQYPLKHCTANFAPSPRISVTAQPGGTVTTTPTGIQCGATCTQVFPAGTQLSLSAIADANFRFDGFVEAECRAPIRLTKDVNCTPVFTSTTAGMLRVNVIGNGRVTSNPAGIDCGNDCSETFPPGITVTLTPVPLPNHAFSAWSGDADCSDGQVRLDAALSCTATFVLPPPSGWQPVGDALSQSSSLGMGIDVDSSAASGPVMYAAVAQNGAGNHIDLLVYRFDGNNWTPVGGNLIESGVVSDIAFTPAIVARSGGLTVAWAENRRRIRVKQWTGTNWAALGDGDNLNIDPNPQVQVFGTQLVMSDSGSLVVAWLETVGNSSFGRMAFKRYSPAGQFWSGNYVLPTITNVLSIRLTTEVLGHGTLMFVPFDAASATLEGPVRVIRQDNQALWADVCTPLSRPSASGVFYPNTQIGFGIARGGLTRGPVAMFNNGEAIFAVKCSGIDWTGLDGSALGQVAAVGQGESLYALSVNGASLAWSKIRQLVSGDREIPTQVLVENPTETALVESGTPLTFFNTSFTQQYLSHTFLRANSPVLAGPIPEDSTYFPRVFRYEP